MGRRKGARVDGVILLDKPTGISSNGALQRVRRAFGAAKAGHTGTLDPLASGLLPITLGEATKFSQHLLDADKTYEARVALGVVTDTGDREGEVLRRSDCRPSRDEVLAACEAFVGEIQQIPPMYSALKRDGRPLYDYARQGIDVPRAPRQVHIHGLVVTAFSTDSFVMVVRCSKGTYIRTLAEDIGEHLGCGAHLDGLIRTEIGSFSLNGAWSLAALEAAGQEERHARLLAPDALIGAMPVVQLSDREASCILHGQSVMAANRAPCGLLRLYWNQRFLGVGRLDEDGKLISSRLLATLPA